jgi:hypothetical protein
MSQLRGTKALDSVPRCQSYFSTLMLVVVGLILLCFVSASAQSVDGPGDQSPPIDKATKAEIIDSLSATLNKIYVFPEVAKKMEKHMRGQLKKGAYDDLTTTADFTVRS